MTTPTTNLPPWYAKCIENIEAMGGTLCDQSLCEPALSYIHNVCNCLPPYVNGCAGQSPSPGCCVYTAASPIPIFSPTAMCYCCCGEAGAVFPLVATGEDSHRSVQDLAVGDTVYVATDATLSKWVQQPLTFCVGIGSSSDAGNPILRITFQLPEGGTQTLWVSLQQVFLMDGGKLKRANRLVPGLDALLDKNGHPLPITEIAQGQTNKGTYTIATSLAPAHSPDGHLILMEGVVSGDFALQLSTNPALFVPDHEAMPVIGSTAYPYHSPKNQ